MEIEIDEAEHYKRINSMFIALRLFAKMWNMAVEHGEAIGWANNRRQEAITIYINWCVHNEKQFKLLEGKWVGLKEMYVTNNRTYEVLDFQ